MSNSARARLVLDIGDLLKRGVRLGMGVETEGACASP